MPDSFAAAYAALKPILEEKSGALRVKTDTPSEYTVLTRGGNPEAPHKGMPIDFGSVRMGKAYVSFHLLPLYMCPTLNDRIPESLKKRMQGKTCFNFKTAPAAETLAELRDLTGAAFEAWQRLNWI